jgi:hypothetical protein
MATARPRVAGQAVKMLANTPDIGEEGFFLFSKFDRAFIRRD